MRGVARRVISPGARQKVSSISASTGVAPTRTIAVKQEIQLHAGTITSSPGPTPSAASAHSSAAVPLVTASAYLKPYISANSRSSVAAIPGGLDGSWP